MIPQNKRKALSSPSASASSTTIKCSAGAILRPITRRSESVSLLLVFWMVAALVMGASVSLLSATTTLLVGAGCFALGYFLALAIDNDDKDDVKRKSRIGLGFLRSWARALKKPRSDGDSKAANDRTRKQKQPALLEIESLAEILEDFKMVLVARNDLKMGKGKIAAQCSHATLGLYKKLLHRAPKSLNRWEMCGQVKVVLKIDSEEDLLVLQERAKSLKLPTHITIDAGRTQIAPNSRTVMAILGPADVVDDVTGGLKLL